MHSIRKSSERSVLALVERLGRALGGKSMEDGARAGHLSLAEGLHQLALRDRADGDTFVPPWAQ
jgi:hypothetical protein